MNKFVPINLTNLDEIHKFLERQRLPKLIQEETDNLNICIYVKEI